MDIKRKARILAAGKSPSKEAMKRTLNRALLNGGVTVDFSANVENIRELSRKMGVNILPSITTRNLFKWSEDISGIGWVSDSPVVTRVLNTTIAPDGTLTADKITENINLSHQNIYQIFTAIANKPFTFSIYLKAAERNIARLTLGSASIASGVDCYFDLNSGTVINTTNVGTAINSSSSITNVGSGWYRCIVSTTLTTNATLYPATTIRQVATSADYAGTAGNGFYIWGAQLEQNTGATTYQPTKETQTNLELTSANFLYVPSSYGESKNFVQNPSLRNMFRYSEDLTDSVWNKLAVTVTPNATTAPNGTLTADKLVNTVANSLHVVLQVFAKTLNPNHISWYVKAAEYTKVGIRVGGGNPSPPVAVFDLASGTLVSNANFLKTSIVNVGGGWYLVSVQNNNSFNATDQIPQIGGLPDSYTIDAAGQFISTGDGVSGIYAWGGQFEISAIPTPYQRTTDAISDFTFTRATSATVTNKQGVIEDSCYNLFQWSEDFSNAYWVKTNSVITENVIVAPNRTLTADKLQETTSDTSHYVRPPQQPIPNSYNTFSIYAKKGERSNIWLRMSNSINALDVYFDLNTKAVTFNNSGGGWTNLTYAISEVGDGWFLCSTTGYSLSLVSGGLCLYALMDGPDKDNDTSYIGTSGYGLYIWGAQLTQGSTPRPYLRTTNRLNVPRLDYSRSLLEPSLLIEPQRTNLLLQSENIIISGWTISESSVSANTNLNPFGVNKSQYVLDNATNAPHVVYQGIANLTSGTTYTASWYVKKADDTWCQLSLGSVAFGFDVWKNFNFDTGTFGNGGLTGTWSLKPLINGYWLISVSAPSIATGVNTSIAFGGTNNTNAITRLPSYVGTNRRFVDIVAMQLEQGSNATSYIPTTTATVTRNGETSYVDLSNNNMLNKDNFTLYCEGYFYGFASTFNFITMGLSDQTANTTNTNQIAFFEGFKGAYVVSGAATVVGTYSSNNSAFKAVIQYNNGTLKFFKDGAQMGTSYSVPVFDYKYLFANTGGATYSVDKIALFNRTLTDLECISITQL